MSTGGKARSVVKTRAYELRHSPSEVFNLLYWPLFDLLAWGLLTAFLEQGDVELPIPIAYLLGAALLWNVLYRVQQDLSLTFMSDIWMDHIITVFASPMTPATYLRGSMIWALARLAVQFAIMTGLAWIVFSFGLFSLGFALLPFMAMLMMFGVAMAFVVLGIVIRVGHGANEMAWALVGIVQPLAAVYYPVSVLPGWGRAIARLLPPAHIFEGMRAVIAGATTPWGTLGIAFALNVVYLATAMWFVLRMLRTFRARGFVTRYA